MSSGNHFTASGGNLYRNGIYMVPETAHNLLALWRKEAAEHVDWWGPFAGRTADGLEAAMIEAGYLQQQDAA